MLILLIFAIVGWSLVGVLYVAMERSRTVAAQRGADRRWWQAAAARHSAECYKLKNRAKKLEADRDAAVLALTGITIFVWQGTDAVHTAQSSERKKQ